MYESLPVMLFISPVFSVTPGSRRSSGGYSGCIPAYPTKRKGALGPLLSALAGASKRETPRLSPVTVQFLMLLYFTLIKMAKTNIMIRMILINV